MYALKSTFISVFHILLSHYIIVLFILIRYRSKKFLYPTLILAFLIGIGFFGVFINGAISLYLQPIGYLIAISLLVYKSNNTPSAIMYLLSAVVFGFMRYYFTPINMSVIEYFAGFNDYGYGIDYNNWLLVSLYMLYIPVALIGFEVENQHNDNDISIFEQRKQTYFIYVLISLILVVFGSLGYPHRFNSESWYAWNVSNVRFSSQHMPTVEELGNYEELSSSHEHASVLLFAWDSVTLNVTYNQDEYLERKTDILDNYNYITSQVIGSFDRVVLHEFSTEINGYTYMVVEYRDQMEYDYEYIPYRIALIGYNDESNTIKYMYFNDSDLDYITSTEPGHEVTLEDFIRQYFDISD